LSANTIARRTEDIGSNLSLQLKDKANGFEWFSIAVDETTDATDSSQLLVFIRGVGKDFEITEELAALQ
jgi:hypothetical protein